MSRSTRATIGALVMTALAAAAGAQSSAGSPASLDETLPIPTAPWKGDLDGMAKRRVIRALVVDDRMLYFIDRGTQRGASYEALKIFEKCVNETRRTGEVPIRIVFYPVRRDRIIPMLRDGLGDLAAADLKVTPERRALVDFSSPLISGIDEIAVTGPASPPLETVDDLSGREVFVRRSSGYWEHLERLNERFAKEGRKPVRLRAAPEDLQDGDLLEMLNAGLVPLVVCDDIIARFWAKVLPDIRPRPAVAVARHAEVAWMFRRDSPELKRTADGCLAKYPEGSLVRNEVIDEYMKRLRWVKHARSEADLGRFQHTVELFRKYGAKYDLDYLLVMAQGYQESQLNQDAHSRVGAIGIMQLMPETGRAMDVGDIREIEANIHAGVKYIRFMEDKYFADAPMTTLNKGLFAFASYNAGPNRVEELRRVARERGLDPNVWFNNVELVAAATIGRQTVEYVSNIYKYYIAYTLIAEDERAESETLRELEKKGR